MSMTVTPRSFGQSAGRPAQGFMLLGGGRAAGRACLLVLLCALGGLGGGCKTDKPLSPDMSMTGGGGDMSSLFTCESTKCENPDAKCCNGEPCVDVTASTQNCGQCGKVCRTRELCQNGSCTCNGGGHSGSCASAETCCSDGCHETQTDVKNCGGCGLPCKMGETCQTGKCSCGASGMACRGSQTCCGAGCADLQTDPNNCGTCGKKCASGKACAGGVCEGECIMCSMGETCCDGICANLLNDPNNCKTCGHKCGVVLGIPLPCIFGICAFAMPDGGTDMTMPTD